MISNHGGNGYLSRSLPEATLGDLTEYQLALGRRGPFGVEVHRFLEPDETGLVMETSDHPLYDLPHVHHGLAACFLDWKLVTEIGSPRCEDLSVPSRRRVEVAPGRHEVYLDDGAQFYELPDGDHRVILIRQNYDYREPYMTFSILGPLHQRQRIERELAALRKWNDSNHYLSGQAIRADGTLFGRSGTVSWEEIALDPTTREILRRNTEELLDKRETFVRLGVPQKRGILLHGPPGTGKTMIGKALAGLGAATFIYMSAADAESLPCLRHVFQLARRLRPTILFMEDLDLFAERRGHRVDPAILGELLAQMDGLEENDGLIVIATTNDLEAIEPALKDRPSRFDVVLEVGLPKQQQRGKILRDNLRALPTERGLLEEAAEATDGLTGAQVREVAFRAPK